MYKCKNKKREREREIKVLKVCTCTMTSYDNLWQFILHEYIVEFSWTVINYDTYFES